MFCNSVKHPYLKMSIFQTFPPEFNPAIHLPQDFGGGFPPIEPQSSWDENTSFFGRITYTSVSWVNGDVRTGTFEKYFFFTAGLSRFTVSESVNHYSRPIWNNGRETFVDKRVWFPDNSDLRFYLYRRQFPVADVTDVGSLIISSLQTWQSPSPPPPAPDPIPAPPWQPSSPPPPPPPPPICDVQIGIDDAIGEGYFCMSFDEYRKFLQDNQRANERLDTIVNNLRSLR